MTPGYSRIVFNAFTTIDFVKQQIIGDGNNAQFFKPKV